ncbi:MAG: SLC13 family permease [Myxococcota bacterium]|nr:SLC13 family permease [Myxococcota bacterium]
MAIAIFALTYLFIAGVRVPWVKLDRTGGALLGAVLMVVTGAVLPEQVMEAIDGGTIVLLLGMMMLASYLSEAAFFRAAAYHAVRVARTPRTLLVAVSAVSAVMSAFLVNDTVCLMLTPLVLAVVAESRLPPLPYLLALCMSSNAGSAATFTGNPQNMLIQGASGIPYATFLAHMALPAALSTGVVIGVLLFAFRHQLPREPIQPHPPPPPVDRPLLWLSSLALLGVVVAFFLEAPMGWAALAGAAFVMTVSRHEPRRALERVDYQLLLFFSALFIVVYGVNQEGWADRIHQAFAPLLAGGPIREAWGFAGLSLLASNLFSNVPFVMLARSWVPALQAPGLGWEVLALSSTLAGNLTLVGSVANLIVFELAKEKYRVGFWEYAKLGIPVTLISLVLGMAALLAQHALLGTLR